MLDWFPNIQGFLLPGAAHGLQMQNPRGMAEALSDFWSRHPIQRWSDRALGEKIGWQDEWGFGDAFDE